MANDDNFRTALSMCQMLLKQRLSSLGRPLTPGDITNAVAEISQLFKDADQEELKKQLELRFTIYTPDHQTLYSNDDHEAWLPARSGSIPWRYWDRYRLLLEEQLAPTSVDSIDKITGDVLARLEDPLRAGAWDRRGLVMGHVQSGKTANYCGLICKAADAGYKVIFVLAGIHNSLRSQTQIRLDEGFLGFMSEPRSISEQTFKRVGVGKLDASVVANTGTNRTEKGDFSKAIADQFGIQPGGLPLVFVVKKNVSVLKNLIAWIRSCANAEDPTIKRRFVRNVPLLVIDDEADLASIDTKAQAIDEKGNPNEDHSPTKINEHIRRLLRAFEKAAYVAYTATPFANIYIHDKGFVPEFGDDLFPRSFIVNIPAPDNYVGPTKVFGLMADNEVGLEEIQALPLVRVVKDYADSEKLDETCGWMPPKLVAKTQHQPRFNGKPSIPPSLREAIIAYILSVVVRKFRDVPPRHNSMLIHVVRFTNVQKIVAEQVETTLKEIVQRLRHGDGERLPTILDEFHALWLNDFVPTHDSLAISMKGKSADPLPDWDHVAMKLPDVVMGIKIKVINGTAGDVLDYEDHKAIGMDIIAIGGDKLSRGLTLEGLTVSYFLRASRMYDTLMQMGRWFGYRDGYLDVCRLYTSAELLDWFTHIAAASEELQLEFRHMVNVGGTPKDYGLKVRSHPALLVTSAVKMRHGQKMKLSFAGDISETIIFDRDPVWLTKNLNAVKNWIGSLGSVPEGGVSGGYTWRSIPAEQILSLLRSYTSHEEARRANTQLLSRYISTQVENGELKDWTVRLSSSGINDARRDKELGLTVGLIKRASFPKDPKMQRIDRYTIRQLVSPADELADLSATEREKALALTVDTWNKAGGQERGEKPPNIPGRREARIARDKSRGLLLIYPLDPKHADIELPYIPVIGMALSFPASDTAREISYIVNNVFTSQGGDDETI